MAYSSYQQEMPMWKFQGEMWNTIPSDWQNFIEFTGLKEPLLGQLKSQYYKFRPRYNGEWLAEPALYNVFSWTACPVNQIRAIFLDMKPMLPAYYAKYRSIGCGFGVRRRPANDCDILKLNSIGNLLRLVHEVAFVPWTVRIQEGLQEKFHNGFNPLYLSRNNRFLFLQLQLTNGPKTNNGDDDLNQWATGFVLPLLRQIGQQTVMSGRPPIPVIQLYNNKFLEVDVDKAPGLMVFRPSFMGCNIRSGTKYISYFTDDRMFQDYVQEIDAGQYGEHRKAFLEIYSAIYKNPAGLTFTDHEIL